MISERIQRYRCAKDIACAALEQPLRLRQAFVADKCGGDEALQHEVNWLIEAAEDPASDRLSNEFQAMARQAVEDVRLEAPLPRNYRLIKRLDEGGMGVVYLAERVDGDMRQQVALKLLHVTSVPDESMARRFASERKILASLSHPNIAHLIDGGLTAEGRPFLAMEYVDGERIDRWCERHELSLRARIKLFMKICAAVEYAHRHMVIHRDIKPANILVTTDGEPKLLDFGIARLLEDGADTTMTEAGRHALTMAYASPEQIEGRALSTATDVYSLGVVLYQLLAGVRPFDHLESVHLLPGAIVSGDMSPPSKQTRLRSPPLPRSGRKGETASEDPLSPDGRGSVLRVASRKIRIPGDVDAIVLKALRKEPAQRYASVKELAEDLKHFLSSRPVLARRGHWLYYGRHFAWRHRWGVAATFVLAFLLGVFMLNREAQLERIAWERDRAQAVTEFMNDLFMSADSLPSRGNEVTVREMLDQGARELLSREGLDSEIRSHMLLAMGRAYNALSMGEKALPLLETAASLKPPLDKKTSADILTALATAYSSIGDLNKAIEAAATAIDIFSDLPGDNFEKITEIKLIKLQNHLNLLDIPLTIIVPELNAILDDLISPKNTYPSELALRAYYALFSAYSYQGHAEAALNAAKQARAIGEQIYNYRDPRSIRYRLAHATAVMNIYPERSIELFESLIFDYQELIGPSLTLANIYNSFGIALSMFDKLEASLAAHETALSIADTTGESSHKMAHIYFNLANRHLQSGNPQAAKTIIEELMEKDSSDAVLGSSMNEFDYSMSLSTLAYIMAEQGNLKDAERYYAKAEIVLESIDMDAWPRNRRRTKEGLIEARIKLGRYTDAYETLNRLDKFNKAQQTPSNHPDALRATTLRLKLLNSIGEYGIGARFAARTHANGCDTDQGIRCHIQRVARILDRSVRPPGDDGAEASLPECDVATVAEISAK